MSLQGIILINILGVGLIILILNLIRTKKLHLGYAAIWFLAVITPMIIVSVPSLLKLLPGIVGATYPASALSLLAFVFIFLVLVVFSVQLSIISARQVELMQAIALYEFLAQEKQAGGNASSLPD